MDFDKEFRRPKPHFDAWQLTTITSGLRIFQAIGVFATLGLLWYVGNQFTPTYAVSASCVVAFTGAMCLLATFSFDLPQSTKGVNWIFWELLYTSSFCFLFFLNTIVLLYSSLRWQHGPYWLATVVCTLSLCAFSADLFRVVSAVQKEPAIRYSKQ